VADNDNAVSIYNDRLPKSELFDGRGNGINGRVIDSRIRFIR